MVFIFTLFELVFFCSYIFLFLIALPGDKSFLVSFGFRLKHFVSGKVVVFCITALMYVLISGAEVPREFRDLRAIIVSYI